jgi:hypothetical protein
VFAPPGWTRAKPYHSLTTLSDKTAPRVTQQGFSHMNQSLEDRIRERVDDKPISTGWRPSGKSCRERRTL